MKHMNQLRGERKYRPKNSPIIFLDHDGKRMIRRGTITRPANGADLAVWRLPVLTLKREVRA